ncbi:hypothetical protein Nmul_A1141 [Nitrosospira multiformis ATCC 25196]|uniref:Uncharacterized protein n=1 Tax=Nitrosospira multiformis (strain ATCC 25196 / NCIMB 11849 / C 71) TaxID=323848 RepID=Q2Y9X7_NITMU|nr:hypothetical protein Nmul_A1141 [Nitrosospira multiformis ATCC 25196]
MTRITLYNKKFPFNRNFLPLEALSLQIALYRLMKVAFWPPLLCRSLPLGIAADRCWCIPRRFFFIKFAEIGCRIALDHRGGWGFIHRMFFVFTSGQRSSCQHNGKE